METLKLAWDVGKIALCVGCPTAIAARLILRGGIALARHLAVGAVATATAYAYMQAQGDGGGGGVPGFPGVSESDFAVEVFTLSYEIDGAGAYFELNDNGTHLTPEDTKHLIAKAKGFGETKEIKIIDRAQENGGAVIQVRNFTQSLGLDFILTDEEAAEEESK